jgi:hypothetical protein
MRTFLLCLGAAACCSAQGVEFIGLEETNRQTVEDKLDRLPDGRIHYCAADLKKAGFADASVNIYVARDRTLFTVVTVVEGKRSGEIQYRPAAVSDLPNPEVWTYESAIAALANAKDAGTRVAAAKALQSFGGRDGAWRALAAGMRDSDPQVSFASQQSISWLRSHLPRRVDWAPAEADLAAILRGTNPFAFVDLVRTLSATSIDPVLAVRLLREGGGRLLLAHLDARHAEEHRRAHIACLSERQGFRRSRGAVAVLARLALRE